MPIRIEKIVYPGRSLARQEGKIIFTNEGLPGELVEVEILKEKKNYLEARTTSILEPSAERQPALCEHYRVCSPYQIMTYDLELRVKKEQLQEIFFHLKENIPSTIKLIPSPAITAYRNKIRLSLNWQANPPYLAYHEPGSRTSYLPVDRCALVSESINSVMTAVNTLLKGQPIPGLSHMEIRQSFWTGEILVVLEAEDEENLEKAAELWVPALSLNENIVGVTGLINLVRRKQYHKLYGRDYLEEKIGQTIFRYGAGSFFQVNPPMLEKVVKKMKEHLSPAAPVKLVDLYAGLGTFGLLLSDLSSEVLAVEAEPSNIFYLKKNMKLNRLQHLTIAEGKSEEWIEEILDFQPEAMVIDPPRRGMVSEIIEALKSYPLPLIFYLSCNPTTLARDLMNFMPEYEIVELTAFDFFPRTPHLETLAVLKGKAKSQQI
ncbi:MAG: 23S rRNA (uracil(1939)-C(5))-methyltransferase RlmD [Candidatus Aminicenantes bacterium]|nr:23S rRNA (uracil(1939)-C(5))-methyltransferase RlmD [Candidatus Aminicenantes bacterium]